MLGLFVVCNIIVGIGTTYAEQTRLIDCQSLSGDEDPVEVKNGKICETKEKPIKIVDRKKCIIRWEVTKAECVDYFEGYHCKKSACEAKVGTTEDRVDPLCLIGS